MNAGQAGQLPTAPHPIVKLALKCMRTGKKPGSFTLDKNGATKIREALLAEKGKPDQMVASMKELGIFAGFLDHKTMGDQWTLEMAKLVESVISESGVLAEKMGHEARKAAEGLRSSSEAFQRKFQSKKAGGSGLPDF